MTKPTTIIETTSASGEEIYEIVQACEPVLANFKRAHVIIANISMAIALMNPDVTPETMQEGVNEVSKFICLFLEGKDLSNESQGDLTIN